MDDPPILLKAGETWLIEQWLERLSSVLESMADDRPSLTLTQEAPEELGPYALVVEQKFSQAPDPALWIGVPDETWRDLGTRILQAAGVETVSDEESRNTTLEIIQQAAGGLAQTLTQRLQREITSGASREIAFFPEGLAVARVVIQYGEKTLPAVWIALAPFLNGWLAAELEESRPEPAAAHMEAAAAVAPLSKTFDLLLDVAMPVSVSFGRTSLAVKEVLKLTTGSIVELNRAVSEPVDVIVNNCVIARGEVVVVDGNYGVRIQQIVSRAERLNLQG